MKRVTQKLILFSVVMHLTETSVTFFQSNICLVYLSRMHKLRTIMLKPRILDILRCFLFMHSAQVENPKVVSQQPCQEGI